MSKKDKLTLKEYFKIAGWSLGLGFKYSKFHFSLYLITEILLRLRSLIYSYFFAQIIDEIINMIGKKTVGIKEVVFQLLWIFFFNIVFILVRSVHDSARQKINMLSRIYLQKYEYVKVHELGLQTIQIPEVNNLKDTAHRWLNLTNNLNYRLLNVISNFALFLTAGIYVFKIMPTIIPLFLAYMIIFVIQERHFFKKTFDWETKDRNVEEKNKSYYLGYMLSESNYIGEISIVGSFNFMTNKINKFFKEFYKVLFEIINKRSLSWLIVDFLDTCLIMFAYVKTFLLLINENITVGQTTFYISAVEAFDNAMLNFSSSIVESYDYITKLSKVYEFYQLEPKVKDGDIMLPRLETPPSIEFKNVEFAYPNSKEAIFKNFNLRINSGEKIAIVGANGAGKSTLTKLIARLYDPQKGEIIVNDTDLKELKIDDWYKNMGLLFQDFKIYDPLTVEENIYLGKTAKQLDKDLVIESAKNADAHDFISKYPKKYNTYMNERYKDGIQPSKGQKQKIAIARFFYRNAPLAIFDEPTSAIDAESEYRIFNRIYEFFDNKTVIIISHRFSTVRNADRIIVLDEGKIVEEGSHKELMSLDGKYAKAFHLQAQGYKD